MLKKWWWKILCVILLPATLLSGLLMAVPAKSILNESIRNYFFHPPMWIVMMTMFVISIVHSIKYLRSGNLLHDAMAKEYANTGFFFGILGLCTGMFWANFTWGAFWTGDPKLTGTVIGLLIYAAYFVLRSSLIDIDKRARISAIYNIFAFAMLFPTLIIIPRMVESLHPGGSGNPVINSNDVSPKMFHIFWSLAVPGWLLLGLWITSLKIRIYKLKAKTLS
jgi:heme exporter protein C